MIYKKKNIRNSNTLSGTITENIILEAGPAQIITNTVFGDGGKINNNNNKLGFGFAADRYLYTPCGTCDLDNVFDAIFFDYSTLNCYINFYGEDSISGKFNTCTITVIDSNNNNYILGNKLQNSLFSDNGDIIFQISQDLWNKMHSLIGKSCTITIEYT